MQATDKEFFDHEMSIGVNPENPEYFMLMDGTANIIKNYARNIIEIGAGMGTLGECLIHKGCDYYGIEPNKYHRDFAKTRGIELHDLGGYPSHAQMIVSIEVLEHLTGFVDIAETHFKMAWLPNGLAEFSAGLAMYSCSNTTVGSSALAASISASKIYGLS